MYLIKGFGFILIVNCLLHPLFIANISGALRISNDFFPPLVLTSISTMTQGLGFMCD